MRSSSTLDDQSKVLHELCSMVAHIIKFPSPTALPVVASASGQPRLAVASMAQVSPAAFASLFVGISLALMLFGSVTFVIGLILMPLVVLLALFFYMAGMVSALSELARATLCSVASRQEFIKLHQGMVLSVMDISINSTDWEISSSRDMQPDD